ncbi:hypothetical protein OAF54_02835 [bacterium]|nr:hypothetical protein [bacterium]
MSYLTVGEAQYYFDGRLGTSCWDDSSPEDQTKALTHATRIIDRLNFVGCKSDAAQELQFPRNGDTDIPQDIKNATSEVALALLDGVNPEMEFENIHMTSQGYGGARSSFDRSVKPPHVLAGIPSFTAWTFLKPYLRDTLTVDLFRTS